MQEELVLFERTDRSPIRLGDLASVSRGFEEAVRRERFNGQSCLTLEVVKVGSADSVKLVRQINTQLSFMSQDGVDVELDFVSDDDSDADLLDLISIKRRIWEPELEE